MSLLTNLHIYQSYTQVLVSKYFPFARYKLHKTKVVMFWRQDSPLHKDQYVK